MNKQSESKEKYVTHLEIVSPLLTQEGLFFDEDTKRIYGIDYDYERPNWFVQGTDSVIIPVFGRDRTIADVINAYANDCINSGEKARATFSRLFDGFSIDGVFKLPKKIPFVEERKDIKKINVKDVAIELMKEYIGSIKSLALTLYVTSGRDGIINGTKGASDYYDSARRVLELPRITDLIDFMCRTYKFSPVCLNDATFLSDSFGSEGKKERLIALLK